MIMPTWWAGISCHTNVSVRESVVKMDIKNKESENKCECGNTLSVDMSFIMDATELSCSKCGNQYILWEMSNELSKK